MMPYIKESDLKSVIGLLSSALELENIDDVKKIINKAISILSNYLSRSSPMSHLDKGGGEVGGENS